MDLKGYQEDKVERLKTYLNELLDLPDNRTCIFEAPTGSGKTLMVSEAIKRLTKERRYGKPLAFIWIAPRMLHGQSKDKLEKYYEDDAVLQCSSIDDLQDNQIQEKEILFLNWESLNKKNNILTTDNEQEKNLSKIVENTKDEGREIILIIDESHHSAKTETARRLLQDISAKVTLEVSATPHLISSGITPRIVQIDFSEVVKEEMIKKVILVNHNLDKLEVNSKSSDSLVINAALHQREDLIKKLSKEKSNVNPLVLIQLPDSKKGVLDKKDEIIKLLKDEFKISEENGKLAIWLSETKTPNLANIEKSDDSTEVLIFKQAIALGWDCPRAAILVLFRDWKSFEFSIQTLGRIMRMPEFKHYTEEVLNRAYVFTNLNDISIAEGISKDYIVTYEAKRNNKVYENVDLPSIHIKREREKTRLSGEMSRIFFETATKNNLHKDLDMKPKLCTELILNGKIEKVDKIIDHVYKEGLMKVKQTDAEVQYIFELFISDNCKPFAPVDSSGRLRTAIYKFFDRKLKITDEETAQKIVLTESNKQKFIDTIEAAKEKYIKEVAERKNAAKVENYIWNVPESITYNEKSKEEKMEKCVMHPFYTKMQSQPEKDFIKALNESKEVIWWFKNGESERNYFAVLYEDGVGKHGFYVDFIFKLKNGKLGIFDTKSGNTAKEAKPKAEALARYLIEQNKKGRKLIGGILMPKGNSWRYNCKTVYEFNKDEDWEYLNLDTV